MRTVRYGHWGRLLILHLLHLLNKGRGSREDAGKLSLGSSPAGKGERARGSLGSLLSSSSTKPMLEHILQELQLFTQGTCGHLPQNLKLQEISIRSHAGVGVGAGVGAEQSWQPQWACRRPWAPLPTTQLFWGQPLLLEGNYGGGSTPGISCSAPVAPEVSSFSSLVGCSSAPPTFLHLVFLGQAGLKLPLSGASAFPGASVPSHPRAGGGHTLAFVKTPEAQGTEAPGGQA